MIIFSIPGKVILMMVSSSMLPSSVESPISTLPVAATSNRQKGSSPHMALALASNSGLEKVGEKTGTKKGSKSELKVIPELYVKRLSSSMLIIPAKRRK